MKKGNISIAIAIAIAMTAVLAISGCVEDAGNLAEDISEIGEKEYRVTLIKGVERDVGVNSEYALLINIIRGRTAGHEGVAKEAEVVIEIFSNNISIGQETLIRGSDQEVRIERLTLELVRVDIREEYASIKIKEKIDVVGYGEKAGETIKKVAEGVVESAASS